jgi:hypothetical protein
VGIGLFAPLEVLVDEVLGVVALVDVAALAIAAPPPATAAVRASVVRRGLIRWLKLVSPPLVA